MLRIDHARKTWRRPEGTVVALDDISLRLSPGDFLAIRGPSGCGKTTLLLAGGGLLAPDSGRVEFGGEDVYSLGADARAAFRAREIGFVFQQFCLIPYLDVLDNVLAAAIRAGEDGARARARELASRLGLDARLRHVPAELSTGERQRTALARALLNRPRLILADEPTGNLDRENTEIVLGELKEFAQAGGAVLLVTHDPLCARSARRVIDMKSGRLEPVPAPTGAGREAPSPGAQP